MFNHHSIIPWGSFRGREHFGGCTVLFGQIGQIVDRIDIHTLNRMHIFNEFTYDYISVSTTLFLTHKLVTDFFLTLISVKI